MNTFQPAEIADRLERFGGYTRNLTGNPLHLFGYSSDGTELLKTARVRHISQSVKIDNLQTGETTYVDFATIDSLLPEISK